MPDMPITFAGSVGITAQLSSCQTCPLHLLVLSAKQHGIVHARYAHYICCFCCAVTQMVHALPLSSSAILYLATLPMATACVTPTVHTVPQYCSAGFFCSQPQLAAGLGLGFRAHCYVP